MLFLFLYVRTQNKYYGIASIYYCGDNSEWVKRKHRAWVIRNVWCWFEHVNYQKSLSHSRLWYFTFVSISNGGNSRLNWIITQMRASYSVLQTMRKMAFACILKWQMWNENKNKRKNQPKIAFGMNKCCVLHIMKWRRK